MAVRGIRGAVRAASNERGEIRDRTQELLRAIVGANRVRRDAIAAAFFTMTPDLTPDSPAHAARDLGWTHVPIVCSAELPVDGGMDRVIRVLLLVNTLRAQNSIQHQYLGDAECLRPDLAATGRSPSRRRRSSRSSSSTNRSAGETR